MPGYKRGVKRFEKKDYLGAIEDFNFEIRKKPNNAAALRYRGDAKRILGDYAGSLNLNSAVEPLQA